MLTSASTKRWMTVAVNKWMTKVAPAMASTNGNSSAMVEELVRAATNCREGTLMAGKAIKTNNGGLDWKTLAITVGVANELHLM